MLTNPELLKVFSKLMSVCVMFTNCMQVCRLSPCCPSSAQEGFLGLPGHPQCCPGPGQSTVMTPSAFWGPHHSSCPKTGSSGRGNLGSCRGGVRVLEPPRPRAWRDPRSHEFGEVVSYRVHGCADEHHPQTPEVHTEPETGQRAGPAYAGAWHHAGAAHRSRAGRGTQPEGVCQEGTYPQLSSILSPWPCWGQRHGFYLLLPLTAGRMRDKVTVWVKVWPCSLAGISRCRWAWWAQSLAGKTCPAVLHGSGGVPAVACPSALVSGSLCLMRSSGQSVQKKGSGVQGAGHSVMWKSRVRPSCAPGLQWLGPCCCVRQEQRLPFLTPFSPSLSYWDHLGSKPAVAEARVFQIRGSIVERRRKQRPGLGQAL